MTPPKKAKTPTVEVERRDLNRAYDRFIGIDPGTAGSMALLAANGQVLEVINTPVICVEKKAKTKKGNAKIQTNIELQSVVRTLREWTQSHRCFVAIERVQPMGQEGVMSIWGFASGYFIWPALAVALGVPYQLFTPVQWKKGMGLSDVTTAELVRQGHKKHKAKTMLKEADRQKALQLFPDAAHLLQHKGDHGKADALLIAEYARRTV